MRNLCCFMLLVLGCNFVYAQERVMTVNVKNSNTNKAVAAYSIKFQHGTAANKVSVHESKDYGKQQLYVLPEDSYTIQVQAEGYKPMQASLLIDASVGTLNFELEPNKGNTEFDNAYIKAKHASGYIFLTGYITEEYTHVPLANVDIRTSDNQVLATTNDKGYYECSLPLSSTEASIGLYKQGYLATTKKLTRLCDGDDQINNFTIARSTPVPTVEVRLNGLATVNENLRTETTQATNCPSTIKVGTTCSGTSCTGVDVVSMETYTRRVLVSEWLSCWGNPAGGMNSLQAGAVAVRSYGMWYVYHPINATYDICSTTSCQVYSTTETTNGNNATANTANYILETGGAVARAEYAAEQNNNPSCGNGFTGTGATAWPCAADGVCTGQTYNGHGRGMCQNGSARWATGLALTSSTCSFGASNGFGAQTWQWIIGHYYPSYTLTTCVTGSTTCTSASPTPVPTYGTSACPGTAGTLTGTVLTWNAVTGANGYTISISKYPYGSSNLITGFPCSNYPNQVTAAGLEAGMLYRWNMTATGDCNISICTSSTSSTNYFQVPPVIAANVGGCMSTNAVTPGTGATVTYNWYQVGNSTPVQSGSSTIFSPTVAGSYYMTIQYSGSANCSGTVATNASNTLTVASVNGSTCVLPVNLLYFNANASGKDVLLAWKAGQEINMNGYSIERSFDGANFSAFSTVKALNAAAATYSYRDTNILAINSSAVLYYRLKQVQSDGSYKYSATVSVKRGSSANVIEPLHNVFTNQLEIVANLQKTEKVSFNLFDATGRLCYKKEMLINNGSSSFILNDMGYLNKGYYLLQVSSAGVAKTFKVLRN